MSPNDSPIDNCILDPLPDNIRAAILTYAHESELTANAVIEGALKYFLELDTSLDNEPISTAEDVSLLAILPPILQSQAIQYAEKTQIPTELVIELAIAHLLDPDSVTFDDCQVKVEQTSIARLKQYADAKAVTAA
ncbi:hypothetical protein [cf. Phormidesmis sp. LEGE 11477]|uniref:hypothetical protein n=1 Tax=cf. Phormidesmis sp. LEGE 11477 TaxID=1828680 RepID=UPI0018811EDA|nr:hypothetical protein [cf. Phormidesmis sp. LEGE 11477]MBE9062930.1 hypothetical protein [cf. Phormidesmis sp. LEGE 11477]